MLEYFGDDTASDNCGNCSVCNNEYEEKDVTLEVQMILSCINRSGQRYGRSILVDTLRGSKNKKVLGFHLDQLKTYGLMAHYSKEQIDLFMNKLIAEGYLNKTEDKYPILKLTEKSIPLLKNQGTVTMQVPKKEEKKKADNILLAQLKELRKQLAQREGYPPYVIFHDATLVEMSSRMPQALDELGEIKGVGENKRERYGHAFLEIIREYQNEHGIEKAEKTEVTEKTEITEDIENTKVPKTDLTSESIKGNIKEHEPLVGNSETNFINALQVEQPTDKNIKEPTYMKYLTPYLKGQSIDEIVENLGVTPATVENNLLKAYSVGEDININNFIQKEYELEVVRLILDNGWDGTLKCIKEQLPEEASYITIKAVIQKLKRKIGDGT